MDLALQTLRLHRRLRVYLFLKLETGNWKPETGNRKLETGNWKLETGNWKPETGNLRLETENWKPENE
jgi:hypothetical protein